MQQATQAIEQEIADIAAEAAEILSNAWPLFFGHTGHWVGTTYYPNPWNQFTQILLDDDYDFWDAYCEGEYETVFRTEGWPDKIVEAIRFWDEEFYPAMSLTQEAELQAALQRIRHAE